MNIVTKLLIIVVALVVIVCGFVYFQQLSKTKQAEERLNQQLEKEAVEDKIAVNKAENAVNQAVNNSQEIIRTDSNKYSNNSQQLTNKFCEYYCKQGILDSSCAEWAKQNNRSCN